MLPVMRSIIRIHAITKIIEAKMIRSGLYISYRLTGNRNYSSKNL